MHIGNILATTPDIYGVKRTGLHVGGSREGKALPIFLHLHSLKSTPSLLTPPNKKQRVFL